MMLLSLNLFILASITLIVELTASHLKEMTHTISQVALADSAPLQFTVVIAMAASLIYACILLRPRKVYMVDFSCFQPNDDQKMNLEKSEYCISSVAGKFNIPSIDFQRKLFLRSGLGEETYMPYHIYNDDDVLYSKECIARLESEQVIFGSTDNLLRKTKVNPQEIDIIITNCSLYSPNPTFASMIINRYKMREDVKAYHLGGMGCSASVIACNLARDLLKVYPNKYALVISTENLSLNGYFGSNKSQLITNCLFRLGCAAILLTNKRGERANCKYELTHCVRTHMAANDRAYRCAYQMEDNKGEVGVCLSKDLMGVAADALRSNLASLGPHVLPFSEQASYMYSYICKNLLKWNVKQYQPDFKRAFNHFCLHAGGKAVIDGIQKNLFLTDLHMEASRASLDRFGNTSASCLWYVLGYMEAKQHIQKDDIVWMLGLGSGFKCNSAIWKALHDIPTPLDSAWLDCIHRYPFALKKSHSSGLPY